MNEIFKNIAVGAMIYLLIGLAVAITFYFNDDRDEEANSMDYFTICMFWWLVLAIGLAQALRNIPTVCRKLFGGEKADEVIDLRSDKKPPSGGNRN